MYDDGIHNQKQMYKYYAGILPDFATFKPIYKQLTADFGSMVINNKSCDQHLFGKIGWYKAEDRSKLPEPDLNNGDIGNLEDCKISDELRALAILYSFSNLGQGLRYTS